MNIANILTLVRIFLVPLFIISLGYNKPILALIIFTIAGITDALDGFIARRFKQETTLGKVLDPIADKSLLISSFIFIYNSKLDVKFPYWFVIIAISRDIFILLGSSIIYIIKGYLKVEPNIFGKATTFFQILSIITVLLANITYIPTILIQAIIFVTTAFTLISTFVYLQQGLKQL
ncbi:MAG: CDP-diacylglycerol--glycerol-3-phosphate 3-phosphatidyltransferase [Persephonella sp.]|nr:MAG: CDP-diacylglycerol--glycerol-3-phosphate 3-phosphatidyltransferase [Persephonella sp.]